VALVLPADAQVFLGRLTHLDRDAVVRLRPAGEGRTALWARLPWRALVTREVSEIVPDDVTIGAAALLAGAGSPPNRDHEWRWPLPPSMGTVVEEVPAQELREVAAAAAGTLREIAETGLEGRAVGVRVVREALLDHVAIVVEAGGRAGSGGGTARVEVSQRLVQAVIRMGFLGSGSSMVRVRLAGRWVGLAARYGSAWLPPRLGPLTVHPKA
jgi:hypothetical protein